jgi:dUTP pyrophosphatase
MKYSKIRDVKSPSRGTQESAGIDFYIPNDYNEGMPYSLPPGGRVLIPSGIKVSLPKGYALIAFNKSGVASKTGLIVGACVVDEDYQGELHLNLINTNQEMETFHDGYYVKDTGFIRITPGEKITQFVLLPVNYVNPEETPIDNLYSKTTDRGEGGFGSTGKV